MNDTVKQAVNEIRKLRIENSMLRVQLQTLDAIRELVGVHATVKPAATQADVTFDLEREIAAADAKRNDDMYARAAGDLYGSSGARAATLAYRKPTPAPAPKAGSPYGEPGVSGPLSYTKDDAQDAAN
jgi:hypothetical protein